MKRARLDVRRVLCPVDFSPSAAHALDHAVRVARLFDADLDVLHAVPVVLDVVEPFPPVLPDVMAPVVAAAEDELRRFAAPARDRHHRVRTLVRQGDAATVIEQAAAELRADVVVMGTHGRTGLRRAVLGSVAERVLHRVACPVLTVRGDADVPAVGPPFHRILCATDLGPSSHETVACALALAGESDAAVELVHVAAPPAAADARDRLGAEALPAASWCEVTTRVETGGVREAIVARARTTGAELVVVGAHAGALRRVLLGSTASHVVRTAPCAVLVVKAARPSDRPAAPRPAVRG